MFNPHKATNHLEITHTGLYNHFCYPLNWQMTTNKVSTVCIRNAAFSTEPLLQFYYTQYTI